MNTQYIIIYTCIAHIVNKIAVSCFGQFFTGGGLEPMENLWVWSQHLTH